MFKLLGVAIVVGACGLGVAWLGGYVDLSGHVNLTQSGKKAVQESGTAAKGAAANALDRLENKIRE